MLYFNRLVISSLFNTVSLLLIISLFTSCATIRYDRQELFKNEIIKYYLNENDTLLDIGCGQGFHDRQIAYLYPKIYFVLEDISSNNLTRLDKFFKKADDGKIIKSRYQIVLGTTDSIPLISSAYRKILCRKTVHEFSDPSKMINELKRLLADDGELIIVEPSPEYVGQKFIDCKKEFITKEKIIQMFTAENLKLKSADTFSSNFNDIKTGNVIIFTK